MYITQLNERIRIQNGGTPSTSDPKNLSTVADVKHAKATGVKYTGNRRSARA